MRKGRSFKGGSGACAGGLGGKEKTGNDKTFVRNIKKEVLFVYEGLGQGHSSPVGQRLGKEKMASSLKEPCRSWARQTKTTGVEPGPKEKTTV